MTLPGEFNTEDLRYGAAQLKSTLDAPPDVTLTLVRDATGVPLSTISGVGGSDLTLEECPSGIACELAVTAVLEWTRPTGSAAVSATWSIEATVTYPRDTDRCGPPPGAKIEISSAPPEARSASVRAGLDARTSNVAEVIQHVTIRFDDPAGSPAPLWPVVARGHVTVSNTGDPVEPRVRRIPAIWIRVTPDDGRPPIVDGPVKVVYPEFLPASADFPILSSCEPRAPCAEGYWIQILAFDPIGRSVEGTAHAPFEWALDARVSYPEGVEAPPAARLSLTTEPAAAGNPAPASLVLQGSGGSFHLDGFHTVKTVVMTANVGPRAPLPGLSDPLAEASILVWVGTRADPITETGDRWLSDGYLIGDGIAPHDERPAGWAQTGDRPFQAKPFLACAGATNPCSARTGLVIRRYDSANLDRQPDADEFSVDWHWTVFGAPPGATVDLVAVDGATLTPGGGPRPAPLILVAAFVLTMIVVVVLLRRVRVRARDPSG